MENNNSDNNSTPLLTPRTELAALRLQKINSQRELRQIRADIALKQKSLQQNERTKAKSEKISALRQQARALSGPTAGFHLAQGSQCVAAGAPSSGASGSTASGLGTSSASNGLASGASGASSSSPAGRPAAASARAAATNSGLASSRGLARRNIFDSPGNGSGKRSAVPSVGNSHSSKRPKSNELELYDELDELFAFSDLDIDESADDLDEDVLLEDIAVGESLRSSRASNANAASSVPSASALPALRAAPRGKSTPGGLGSTARSTASGPAAGRTHSLGVRRPTARSTLSGPVFPSRAARSEAGGGARAVKAELNVASDPGASGVSGELDGVGATGGEGAVAAAGVAPTTTNAEDDLLADPPAILDTDILVEDSQAIAHLYSEEEADPEIDPDDI